MAKGPVPNITGFDMKKMIAQAGHHPNDPWKRHEAWRYTGPFSARNRWKNSLPGFGIATVAFAAYCAFEYTFLKDDHSHGKGHGDSTTTGH